MATTTLRPDTSVIAEEDAAAYLTKLKHLTYLEPFLGKANCVADAAKIADVPANQLLYHVNKMRKLGILTVDHKDVRRGRELPFYRVRTDELFVPLEKTPLSNLEAYLHEVSTAMLDMQNQSLANVLKKEQINLGFWISYDEENQSTNVRLTSKQSFVDMNTGKLLSDLPSLMGLARIKLGRANAERARQLLAEIHNLTEDDDGEYYLYRFAFTPET